MTEQEWLASVDPVAMLRVAAGRVSLCCGCLWADNFDNTMSMAGTECCPRCDNATPVEGYRRVASDRKLRLFHEAALKCEDFDFVRNIHWSPCPGGHGRRLTAIVVWSGGREEGEQYHHFALDTFALDTDAGSVAHILRDIVGNPWRPVTLPLGEVCGACKGRKKLLYAKVYKEDIAYTANSLPPNCLPELEDRECHVCNGTGHGLSPVLTPTVRALAQAACDERLPDGTLDCELLAVLSDALEEAGLEDTREYSNEVQVYVQHYGDGWHVLTSIPAGAVIRHRANSRRQAVKHAEEVYRVKKWTQKKSDGRYAATELPMWGGGIQTVASQPNPLLAHLRSPGPHWRGCWAVDLILGKE